ncbi:phage tail tape measure protein [Sporosarcina sp. E16_8]|uniref:phage tail tape measure protein n=1 Tax=Sporosarcina sp. E16_8 TaxID=2789295 RepID=UPI001A91B399|nr:phage tail tape measure protein [Sporosarcina sp. E16_8]MBO0586455.1 phage tail tape measure protein [Sporosarcina sp. E16_8]
MAKDTEAKVTFKAFNKDFNKAISEMNKESGRLRQEMKLQSEQMKHSGTESEKLQTKLGGLSKQYELAKQKTSETAAQLERAKATWGANSEEVRKLEDQLNRTRIAEQQIANSMTETTASLQGVAEAEAARTSEAAKAEEQLNSLKSTEEELKNSSEKLTAEYELQKAQLGENASESEKLAAQLEHLNQSHDAASESVRNYEQQLEEAKSQYGENSTEVDNYERQLIEARTAEQQLANEINATASELREQESVLKKTSEALGKVGDKMTDIGKGMTKKITAPIIAVGAGMAKVAIDQENSFAQTSTLLEGSESELTDYKNNIRTLSSEMGVAFGEVAESVYGSLSAGQTQVDAIEFTEKAMKLAGGGFTDTSKAVDVLTTALNAYKLESTEATNISDMLITTQNKGKTTVDELAVSMGAVIPIAQSQGVGFDQLAAGYAVLTKNGVATAEAGTGMKAMFGELGKAGSKVDKILRAGTGKSFSELQAEGNNTGEVLKYLQGVADKSGLKLSDLFGNVRSGGAALILAAEGGAEFDEFLGDMQNSSGATEKAFGIMVDTTKDKMAIAKETIVNTLGQMGDMLLPILADVATKISELATKFSEMSPATQKMIMVIGGIVAAIGPILIIVGTLISAIGSIVGVFATVSLAVANAGGVIALMSAKLAFLGPVFAALTGPVAIAIAAIAGIVAVVILAYNKVEWFRDGVNAAWEAVKKGTEQAFGFVYDIISTILSSVVSFGKGVLGQFKVFWDENGKAIFAIVKMYFGYIKNNIEMVMGIIKGIFQVVWPIISGIVKIAWGLIKAIVKTGIDLVLGIIQTVLKILQGDWAGAWETIWGTMKKVWSNITGYLKDVDLVQIGKDIIQGLIDGITTMVNAVKKAIKNVTDAITGTVRKILGIKSPSTVMKGFGKNTGEGMAIGIASTKGANQKAMKSVTKGIISTAKNADAEIDKILNGSAKKQAKGAKDKTKNKTKSTAKSAAKSAESAAKKQVAAAKKVAAENKRRVAAAAKAERDAVSAAMTAVSSKIADKKATTGLSSAEEAAIWKKSINTFKKGSKERAKAQNSYTAAMKKDESDKKAVVKAEFDNIKQSIDDKKSLDQLSLTQESEIWRKSIGKFKKGSKARIAAQKEYQKALKAVNDSVNKVNEDFNKRAQKIDDDYTKNSSDAVKGYTDAFKNKYESLLGFAGLFDEFEIKMEKTGADLLLNLSNQVDGFARWQSEIGKLSMRGTDETLLAELREMGPKALPELIALNELTDDQLSRYSELYRVKTEQAREQAESELSGMKEDVEKSIEAMRAAANTELEVLQVEWVAQIKAVTKATDDELQSLQQIGRDAGQGLINGLSSMEGALKKQATTMAKAVSETIRKVLDINSPSRVLEQLGVWTGEGLAVGIDNTISIIKASAKNLANAAIPKMTERPTFEAPESNAAIRGVIQSQAPAVDSGPGAISNRFHIENMEVRDDNDIKSIARELLVMQRRHERGRGR